MNDTNDGDVKLKRRSTGQGKSHSKNDIENEDEKNNFQVKQKHKTNFDDSLTVLNSDDRHEKNKETYDNLEDPRGGGDLFLTEQNDSRKHYYDVEEEEGEREEDAVTSETLSSNESVSSILSKLYPFTIKWTFGTKSTVDIVNLTTKNGGEVFFVASHFGVIYDYIRDKIEFLPGHNFPIKTIASDYSGRWLVTADAGPDNVIIIWDHEKKVPAWCLYNVFPDGVSQARISRDALYLAAVNCNYNYTLKFWKWTLGYYEPDATLELNPGFGRATHLNFNQLQTNQLAVTLRNGIVFCEWDTSVDELKTFFPVLESHTQKKLGIFRRTMFLDDNHTAVTSTNTGYIVVWCDVVFTEEIKPEIPGRIEKQFLKAVRIHKSGITNLKICDNSIVTSSEKGVILFHDQLFRLMYVLPKLNVDPIASFSFNKVDNQTDIFMKVKNPKKLNSLIENNVDAILEEDNGLHENNDSIEKQYSDSLLEKAKKIINPEYLSKITPLQDFKDKAKKTPSDCTMERRPFVVRDLIFMTKNGRLGYLSHQRKKIKYFFYNIEASVACLACSPHKSHLIASYLSGPIIMYNYISKRILVSTKIPGFKISSLKYSSDGTMLLAGTENGMILELDPLLLEVKLTLNCGKDPIKKITISSMNDLVASYDTESIVYLHTKTKAQKKKKWICLGKYRSHYKKINDIMFEKTPHESGYPRFYTIGEDRMLVEYAINNSDVNKLSLSQIHRIEQTATPKCFTWNPNFTNNLEFLISNSEYKLKVVDTESRECKKTTLGPTADTPILQMEVLPHHFGTNSSAKMVYATNKHIGLILLPSTGNPFESMGMVAHPVKIIDYALSHDYRYVFTAGENDRSVLMWEIHPNSVDVASQIGGLGLEPFVSLIEGGPNSFFFREVEDFFYYAQIIHQGEDPNIDRSVSKTLALCEIPDLFRTLGYYPTDYEIDNLIYELKHINYNETGELASEISFEECIKAFLNHKPVEGITLNHINLALIAIADLSDPSDILVERTELYKALEERAEAMDHKEVLGYLCILLLPKDENAPIPATLALNDFATNVLGIDLSITEENVQQITHAFENKNDSNESE